MSGLLLAREIISKAHDEISEFCFDDLAKELNKKDLQIQEYSKMFEKENEEKENMLGDDEPEETSFDKEEEKER